MLKTSMIDLQCSPKVRDSVILREGATMPRCPECGSENTADRCSGFISYTMSIACRTTRLKLAPHDVGGNHYCYDCDTWFTLPEKQKESEKEGGA